MPRLSLPQIMLAALFTRLAAHRERRSAQPPLRDLTGALETGAVLATVEPRKCVVDTGGGPQTHLEVWFCVSDGAGIGAFGAFAQVAGVNGSSAIDTNPAAAQFTAPIIQHALQIGGPRGVVHPSLLRPHTSQGDGTDTLRFTSPRRGRREAMAAAGG